MALAGKIDKSAALSSRARRGGGRSKSYSGWRRCCLSFCFRIICSLASQIAITALFALSLDLILGFAGIVSLGHAAYFGVGAYTAGLLSKYGWGEPLSGWHCRRRRRRLRLCDELRHLPLPASRVDHAHARPGFAGGTREQRRLAHRRHRRPSGHPYLEDFRLFPFRSFTAIPPTAMRSPCCSCFSCSRGGSSIRRSACRCAAFARTGPRCRQSARQSRAHIRTIYTIAATHRRDRRRLVGANDGNCLARFLGFQRSADVVVMLVLGGTGRLYGGLVGAAVFMVARDQFSGINPQYWYFWIGILLVAVVMFLPNGILGGLRVTLPRGGAVLSAPRWRPADSPRTSAPSSSPATSRSNCPRACAMR